MLKKMFALTSAMMILAGAVFADEGQKTEVTEVKVCPMSLHPTKENAKSTTFGNYKVYFCCGGCPAAFAKLSDEDKQKKIDAALAKQNEKKEG